MALLKIIIGCFIAFSLTWFTIKFFGENQQFIAYDHPLIKEQGPWIMAYGGDAKAFPSHTKPALEAAMSKENIWLALDVVMSAERSFYLIPHDYFVKSDRRPWAKWKDSEIDALDAAANFKNPEGALAFNARGLKFQKLEEVLNQYPKAKFFLWFRDNERDLDLIIASFLKKFAGLENRVLIYSDFDVVMRSLKEQLPRWVYGSGDGEHTRMLMFDSLGLQSAMTLKGDFYFAPIKLDKVKMVTETIKREIERRKLPLILGPFLNDGEIEAAIKLSPKGYITTDTSHLSKLLEQVGQLNPNLFK